MDQSPPKLRGKDIREGKGHLTSIFVLVYTSNFPLLQIFSYQFTFGFNYVGLRNIHSLFTFLVNHIKHFVSSKVSILHCPHKTFTNWIELRCFSKNWIWEGKEYHHGYKWNYENWEKDVLHYIIPNRFWFSLESICCIRIHRELEISRFYLVWCF